MCKIMKPWSVLATKKAMVVVVVIARVLVSEFLVLNCFWEKMRHRKDLEGGGFYTLLQRDSLQWKSQWRCVD